MPSLVAEIGDVIDSHLRMIGLIIDEGMDDNQKAFIAAKRAEYEQKTGQAEAAAEVDSDFPKGSRMCNKCSTKAVVMMDGCLTCLNCGDSKCG